ncbi:MAG TPA: HAD-IC family P-type ATPase, partial [Kofleriaceae bacterium]|nr:HAD-IC family P-type ATPase [Kofleriaceae bacterium]
MDPGLTTVEARRRLAEHGANALPEPRPIPMWRRALAQLRSPLVYILLFALAFDLGSWIAAGSRGLPLEAVVIALVLALNAGLGAYQEHRSEQALARLRAVAAPHARVVRDGALTSVPVSELVPGDLVRLESGDRIPADARVADAHGLLIDESMLTGESLPVDRRSGEELAAGTLVARGTAAAEVTRTGAASALGKLATLLGSIDATRTPLERRLDDFGRRVARWVIALAALVAAAGLIIEGIGRAAAVLLFAAALAVAAVPEGLPAVVTLTLAMGVQRMARRHAVVRRLAAVEALGSVTVIATDKTGTLT